MVLLLTLQLKRLISSTSYSPLILPWTTPVILLLLLLPLRCSMPLPVISFDQVHGLLKFMNVKKASGQDGIPPRVLRECASELAPSLIQLFSLCLNTSTIPQCWKRALVKPFPKKGSRSDPTNYRPIALTYILSKIFETLLNSHF